MGREGSIESQQKSDFFDLILCLTDEQIVFFLSGIFLAGGVNGSLDTGTASPPGFYNPLTNEYCNLPPMKQPRYGSTTNGFIACGGEDHI